MQTNETRILVLGVGNILYSDEGVGVRCVEQLEAEYDFSENVTLMDGGTLGSRLMDPIMQSDLLIVADAVLGDGGPGSVYRLTGEDLRQSLSFRNSMHQTDLVDTLIYCELAGHRPDAVVVGIEPVDYHTMALELTEPMRGSLQGMKQAVLEEIEKAGGSYAPRSQSKAIDQEGE